MLDCCIADDEDRVVVAVIITSSISFVCGGGCEVIIVR